MLMNWLFEFKKEYEYKVSPSELKSIIQLIVDEGDYGLDKNISAELNSDDTFQLRIGWAPMTGLFYPYSPAILNVKISNNNLHTKLNTVLKPNFSFVFLFYFTMLIIIWISIHPNEMNFVMILVALSIPFIYGMISGVYMYYLRRCFEQILEFNTRKNL